MKTPKKRITFRTPKRISKTPIKNIKPQSPKQKEEPVQNDEIRKEECKSPFKDTVTRYKNIIKEEKTKEKILLESYKKENEYLRSLKSDSLLYKKFIGFDIVENGEGYEVSHEITTSGIVRKIKFLLISHEQSFIYKLLESKNVELPDFLSEEITFDESQVKMFFFKVMEAIITKKN